MTDAKNTDCGSVSRNERDGTTTYVAECDGDRATVTVRGGAAMLTVYDDERNSMSDILIEPVVATLVAAGIVRDTECRSVAGDHRDLASELRGAFNHAHFVQPWRDSGAKKAAWDRLRKAVEQAAEVLRGSRKNTEQESVSEGGEG